MDMEEKAYRVNESIKKFIHERSSFLHVDAAFAEKIADEYVVLIADSGISELIYNRKQPMSLKPGNLFVDMKGSLKAAAEIFAGYQRPDNWLSAIQLMLLLILSLKNIINVKLPEKSAEVLIVLNRMEGFERAVEEEKLLQQVRKFEEVYGLEQTEEVEFVENMNFLDKYGIVEISDGKVILIEKVFGKDFI